MLWFSSAPKARTKPLVLHIDDSETVLVVTQAILEDLGLQVMQATNGTEGVKTAEREKPDLILLDAMMPGMDGYQCCQALRANAKTKDIPILMVTGVDAVKEVERALESGANGYVPKPVQAERLKAKIAEWIKLPTPGTGGQ